MAQQTSTPDASESEQPKLKRSIGVWLLFFFIVGDTLGAGIYTLIGTMADDVGGMLWVPLILALVLALLTAGTYAEMITKYPHAGGAARYAERAFKVPYATFLIGFLMLSSGITTSAALANAFAGDYLRGLVPENPEGNGLFGWAWIGAVQQSISEFVYGVPTAVITTIFLALLIAINIRGVRESLTANVVATVIETTGLVIVIVVAGLVFFGGDGDPSRILTPAPDKPILMGAFTASVVAFFSFLGFEAAANMAEEVKRPSHAYPRALFGAILTAGVIYLSIALGAAIVVDPTTLADSSGPLLEVINASGFNFPSWLFALIGLIAIANGALLFMVMASRATYGLAEAGLLPAVFGRIAPTRRTPWVAIIVVGIVTVGMTFVGDVGLLADTTVLLLVLVFISTNISSIVLRNDKVEHEHFHVPRVIPYLALAASVVLLTQLNLENWLIAGCYVAVGSVLFLIARHTRKAVDGDREAQA